MADSSRLSDDIEAMLNALFPQNTDEARTVLLGYADNEPDRVRKAILKLSEGNLADLKHYVKQGNQDYRDILYWAEYSEG